LSEKGGTGKSTLVRFLSMAADELGKKVCIIDTCQNSSIATNFFEDRDSYKKYSYDFLTGESKPSEVIQQYKESGIYYMPTDERIDDES
jgi:chromosome partitioning protein